jgi:hypothetical protein
MKFALVAALATALALWAGASYYFPETMHQVRLVLLLFAIGGPDE